MVHEEEGQFHIWFIGQITRSNEEKRLYCYEAYLRSLVYIHHETRLSFFPTSPGLYESSQEQGFDVAEVGGGDLFRDF
jgi:hypothetical protein